MATFNQSSFEENEMSSENISSLNDLKSLDFNDMLNVVSYFSMSLGESMDKKLTMIIKCWSRSVNVKLHPEFLKY